MSKDIAMMPPGTPVPPDFDLGSDLVLAAPDDLRQPPQAPEDEWIEHAIVAQRTHLVGQKFRDQAEEHAHLLDAHRAKVEQGGCEDDEPVIPPLPREGLIKRLLEREPASVALYKKLRGMWANGCGKEAPPRDLIERPRLEKNWPEPLGDAGFAWNDELVDLRRSVYLAEDTCNWLSWMTIEKNAINCACWENNALVVAADAPQADAQAVRAYDPREPGLVKQEAVITGYRILSAGAGAGGAQPTEHLHEIFRRILQIDRDIHLGNKPYSFESHLPELPVDYQVWLPNLRKTVWVTQRVLRRQFGRGYGLTRRPPPP